MAATFRSASHAANTDSSSLTIPAPAGVTDGDLLIAQFVAWEHAEGQSALLYSSTGAGTTFSSALTGEYAESDTHRHIIVPAASVFGFGNRRFYTIVTRVASGEPSSYTFVFKTGTTTPYAFNFCAADMLCYQGGYTAFPLNQYAYGWYDPNPPPQGTSRAPGTSWVAPPLDVSTTEIALNLGYAVTATAATMTPPTGTTERTDSWQSGSGFLLTSSDHVPAVSPTGAATFVSSQNGDTGVFVTFAAGPPPAGPGVWTPPILVPYAKPTVTTG